MLNQDPTRPGQEAGAPSAGSCDPSQGPYIAPEESNGSTDGLDLNFIAFALEVYDTYQLDLAAYRKAAETANDTEETPNPRLGAIELIARLYGCSPQEAEGMFQDLIRTASIARRKLEEHNLIPRR